MKKVFLNNRIIAIAFFTLFSLSAATPAVAGEQIGELPVEMKLLGYVKNQPLLQMNFSGNADENKFTIVIRDNQGNALFTENIIGEIFSKRFLLNTDELGDEPLSFEITSRNTGKKAVFKISRHSEFIQEAKITALH